MNPTEPLPEPVVPSAGAEQPTKMEVIEIEDPTVGLSLQFLVAVMLSQGITELRIPKAMLDQAMHKPITATTDADGGFTVRIYRD